MQGTELIWKGFDANKDPITYDLYLSTSESSVLEFSETALILDDTPATSYFVKDLKIGYSYYWIVIPRDHLRNGICLDSIYRFEINSPPEILSISKQVITIGNEFKLEVKATDTSADHVRNFQFNLERAPEGTVIQHTTGLLTWTPTDEQLGEHEVMIWVSDGIDQTNITFEIEVLEQIEKEKFSGFSFWYITTLFIIIIIIISNIGILSTEVGKYKFLSLCFVPLYNKLNRDKVYDNFTRGQIHGYINAKPGDHYNSIKAALKLKNGTLTHHTKVLEKEGLIKIKRDGLFTRFFPVGSFTGERDKMHLKEIQEELLDIIRHQPGITQHEINNYFEISQPSVSYNLTQLARNNLIRVEQVGREKQYFLNPESENYLNNIDNQDQVQSQSPQTSEPTISVGGDTIDFSSECEINKDDL
jgi:predicted transcriptional regulator